MEKTVIVDGKEVRMRASALIPRLYRVKFGRDMIADMRQLQKSYNKAKNLPEGATEEEKQDAQLSVLDLTIFENVAYMMVKHAGGAEVPDNPEDWLDSFDGVFSVYEVLPAILELWGLTNQTTSIPKKK
jgi:hypothetical protein